MQDYSDYCPAYRETTHLTMSNAKRWCYRGTMYEYIISKLGTRTNKDNKPEKCPNCSTDVYTYHGFKRHLEYFHPSDVKHTPLTKKMRTATQEEPLVLDFDQFAPEEVSQTNLSSIESSVVDRVKDLDFFQVFIVIISV